MPDGAVKCPTGPSNSRLYGGNVKSNALGLPGGGADRGWIYSYISNSICMVQIWENNICEFFKDLKLHSSFEQTFAILIVF
jgi:hypothetical protein